MIIVSSVCLLAICCSPHISEVSLETRFKQYYGGEYLIDSTTHFTIEINTYKGLFEGRESFFSFAKDRYCFIFDKIDTLYGGIDIKYFYFDKYGEENNTFSRPQSDFQPHCVLKIEKIVGNKMYIDFDFQDTILPEILKGKYKLKLEYDDEPIFKKYYGK